MPKQPKKKTLKDIHAELTKAPVTKRELVLKVLNVKTNQTFYDVINGTRPLSPAEKIAIAEVYNVKVDDIDWQDDIKPVA